MIPHAMALINAFDKDLDYWCNEEADTNTKIKGLKVLKLFQNGTEILRKSRGSSNREFREIFEENQ
jgi:SpoVK/Ycf46/Vps4 family AAA+-type ATPase